ncbi:uncharacterized protein AAG666_005257 isoform 2-T2 [Megaptera novaeangliae]
MEASRSEKQEKPKVLQRILNHCATREARTRVVNSLVKAAVKPEKGTCCKEGPTGTNMRSAAKPWTPATRVGSHGVDRARPLPAPSPGMKSSKSSTSLAFESRLSKLKRASSEDTLNKPGGAAASGAARLKKTSTSGAVSELAESRLRGPPARVASLEIQAGWCRPWGCLGVFVVLRVSDERVSA